MSILKDKNILLGVTGSIAAYKSVFLLRLLKKEGCRVKNKEFNSLWDIC